MNKFFTQKTCDRCGSSLNGGRTISIFNTDCICIICFQKEKHDKYYDKALKVDHERNKKRQL